VIAMTDIQFKVGSLFTTLLHANENIQQHTKHRILNLYLTMINQLHINSDHQQTKESKP